MQHTASKVKVFMTEKYELFENVDGNRPLNKKKIQRIIAEIQSGNDILDEVPVLVKEVKNRLQVLDGQHRVDIARQLQRPVHYILHKENMTLHNVAKVNSNVEKWTDQDFIRCYVKAGNENYKKLKKFHETYGIAVGICLVLLSKGKLVNDGSSAHESLRLLFEQGLFEVKALKEAQIFAELCKGFSAFKSWNSRPFMVAMGKIIAAEKADMDILLNKFNEDPSRLLNHGNWKSYLTNLEEIYNKGNSKRRTIF